MQKMSFSWPLIRKAFLTGLILLLPLGVTIIVINFLLSSIGTPFRKVLFSALTPLIENHSWIGVVLNLASIFIVVLFITAFGYLSNYFLGKFFLRFVERVITSLPFINTVYKTSKQIVDTLTESQKAAFQKAVLIEYPRSGCYSVGFLTSNQRSEIHERTQKPLVNVFIPTTPNPTSGFLLMVPSEDVIELHMSIGDAMKLIISGGALVPPKSESKVVN